MINIIVIGHQENQTGNVVNDQFGLKTWIREKIATQPSSSSLERISSEVVNEMHNLKNMYPNDCMYKNFTGPFNTEVGPSFFFADEMFQGFIPPEYSSVSTVVGSLGNVDLTEYVFH